MAKENVVSDISNISRRFIKGDGFTLANIFAILVFGIGVIGFSGISYKTIPYATFITLLSLGIALSGFSLLGLMLKYLNYTKSNNASQLNFESDISLNMILQGIEGIETDLKTQQEKLEEYSRTFITATVNSQQNGFVLDDGQKNEILSKISEYFSQDFARNVSTAIEKDIKANQQKEIVTRNNENNQLLILAYANTTSRLNSEIETLGKRANLNLGIGSTISIISLSLLGYFIFTQDFNANELSKVLLHFVPKLSLVIFVEVFAFFFLRLYKTSLTEIKYYQNELTNIQLKQVGLLAATNFGAASDVSIAIKSHSSSERNFILKKGETTVDLEKEKAEINFYQNTLKTIGDIFKKANKK